MQISGDFAPALCQFDHFQRLHTRLARLPTEPITWFSGNGPSTEFNSSYPEVVLCWHGGGETQVQGGDKCFCYHRPSRCECVQRGWKLWTFIHVASAPPTLAITRQNTAPADQTGSCLISRGSLPTAATGSTNIFPDGTDLLLAQAQRSCHQSGGHHRLFGEHIPGHHQVDQRRSLGWISNYAVVPTNAGYTVSGSKGAISVTADWTQNPPVVYATTDWKRFTNRLVSFSDTGSLPTITNLAFGTVLTNATTGYTNTFRGVRFVPVPAPYVVVAPVAFIGNPGITATFTSTVYGTNNTYQWYSNSPANMTYVAIPGATSNNYSLANINTSESGSLFYLFASNSYGTVSTTPVSLTVT